MNSGLFATVHNVVGDRRASVPRSHCGWFMCSFVVRRFGKINLDIYILCENTHPQLADQNIYMNFLI